MPSNFLYVSSPAVCHKNIPAYPLTPETETISRAPALVSMDLSSRVDRPTSRASFRVISMEGLSVRDSAFNQYATGIATIQKTTSAGINIVGQWLDACDGSVIDGPLDSAVEGCQPTFRCVLGKSDQALAWNRRRRMMMIGNRAIRLSIERSNQTPGPVV